MESGSSRATFPSTKGLLLAAGLGSKRSSKCYPLHVGGSRSKRQQERARKDRRARFFTFVGLATGFAAFGYEAIAPEPDVYVGSILFALAVPFLLAGLFVYVPFRPVTKTVIVVVVLGASAWGLRRWVWARNAPSFVFVVPGAWVNSNEWDFMVQHRGPETVYNVVITLMDEDRFGRPYQPSDPPQMRIEFPEISPHKSGFSKQFLWKPVVPDHEHYQVVIESRKANLFQVLNVERVNGQWVWATRIADTDHGNKILLECKDSAFPADTEWSATLRACFPDLTRPD